MSRTYEQLNEQQSNKPTVESPPIPNLPTATQQQLPANSDDGWSDTAVEIQSQVLRGKLLKFADWRWTKGTEGDEVEEGTQLVAIGTAAAWVKWTGGKPVQYVLRQPGKMLPDRDEFGDHDEFLWELTPDNRPRDPWQNTRFVYFLDPISMEMLTFSTSSGGGRSAVINSPIRSNVCESWVAPAPYPLSSWAPRKCKRSLGSNRSHCSRSQVVRRRE